MIKLHTHIIINFKNIFLNSIKIIIGGVIMINLTAKERMLLEDEKSHEELCVSKYKDYASKAKCQELSNLF